MASIIFAQNLWGRSKARIKRKAQDSIEYLRRRDGGSKARKKLYLRRRFQFKILQPVQYAHLERAKRERSRGSETDCLWWEHGYHNCTNEQFKRRLRVNRDTFNFILNAIEDPNFVSLCLLCSGLHLLVLLVRLINLRRKTRP